MKFLMCLLIIILLMIAEKGVPVKLDKDDYIVYGALLFLIYLIV